MKILLTGVAGFIGMHVGAKLLLMNHTIFGLDNINDYYDVNVKSANERDGIACMCQKSVV